MCFIQHTKLIFILCCIDLIQTKQTSMGQFISMIFETSDNQYSELSTEVPKESGVRADMFADLSRHPEFIKRLGAIKKDHLNVPIDEMEDLIDTIVDFLSTYINLSKMGGKHSKLWKGYVHHEDETERMAAIKAKVIEILKVDETSEKDDKTLGYYLKKIITHFFGDECGGFTLADTRETKDIPAIKYMHDHKLENMREYIKDVLKIGGFVFCTEYDWENCLDETCEHIKYHQFDTDIHKDNSAKALFYTDNLVMREFTETEIKAMMTEKKQTSQIGKYETYKDKFTVFTLYNPKALEGELFHDEVIVVGIHATSIGSKSAIKSNLDEYRFLKTVIQSYKDSNCIIIGDFNLPEFTEGRQYFGLGAEDRLTYPFQNSFNREFVDTSTFMTQGFQRYSLYDKTEVAAKERTGRADKNSQSVLGKCFLRGYNTDHGYGRFDISVTSESSLWPPNTADADLMVPLITGDPNSDWLSDHQAPVIKLTDVKGNSYNISAYNVLSKCCSGGQPLKDDLTAGQIENAGLEFYDILEELTDIMLENISP